MAHRCAQRGVDINGGDNQQTRGNASIAALSRASKRNSMARR